MNCPYNKEVSVRRGSTVGVKYKGMYGVFSKLKLYYAWLPPIFFFDSDSSCYDLLFPNSHKPH